SIWISPIDPRLNERTIVNAYIRNIGEANYEGDIIVEFWCNTSKIDDYKITTIPAGEGKTASVIWSATENPKIIVKIIAANDVNVLNNVAIKTDIVVKIGPPSQQEPVIKVILPHIPWISCLIIVISILSGGGSSLWYVRPSLQPRS
ncbi:MAG: CARDB domain-containing protein, partial [Candidatus Hydrothermarchaeota archaeon]|nr:CARDB domain-containing protein [Candidatus Hydrothermarchaeota archaeon]